MPEPLSKKSGFTLRTGTDTARVVFTFQRATALYDGVRCGATNTGRQKREGTLSKRTRRIS